MKLGKSSIQINCELPLCLLSDHNTALNDYDFVLFHLYQSSPAYRQYYEGLRKTHPDRKMILDNSAYEYFITGGSLDIPSFIEAIKNLRPDFFLLPDVLMDKKATLDGIARFWEIAGPENESFFLRALVVSQGNTEEEIVESWKEYINRGYRNLAIPFHNSFFREMGKTRGFIRDIWADQFDNQLDADKEYAIGRCNLIHKYQDFLRENFGYIHLLGSHNPWEKAVHDYWSPGTIDSMDTGYPVKTGIEGYELFQEPTKPSIIIDDFLEADLDISVRQRIIRNIRTFKSL